MCFLKLYFMSLGLHRLRGCSFAVLFYLFSVLICSFLSILSYLTLFYYISLVLFYLFFILSFLSSCSLFQSYLSQYVLFCRSVLSILRSYLYHPLIMDYINIITSYLSISYIYRSILIICSYLSLFD